MEKYIQAVSIHSRCEPRYRSIHTSRGQRGNMIKHLRAEYASCFHFLWSRHAQVGQSSKPVKFLALRYWSQPTRNLGLMI